MINGKRETVWGKFTEPARLMGFTSTYRRSKGGIVVKHGDSCDVDLHYYCYTVRTPRAPQRRQQQETRNYHWPPRHRPCQQQVGGITHRITPALRKRYQFLSYSGFVGQYSVRKSLGCPKQIPPNGGCHPPSYAFIILNYLTYKKSQKRMDDYLSPIDGWIILKRHYLKIGVHCTACFDPASCSSDVYLCLHSSTILVRTPRTLRTGIVYIGEVPLSLYSS
jgi:hypothetical protein